MVSQPLPNVVARGIAAVEICLNSFNPPLLFISNGYGWKTCGISY